MLEEGRTTERLRPWFERASRGFRLRDAGTGELVRGEDPRIRVIKVAGAPLAPRDSWIGLPPA